MTLLLRLLGLLLLAGLALLTSCEETRYVPAALDPKLDSTLRAAGFGPLQVGKIKIAGNVIINTGPGSVTTSDNRNAGRRGTAALGAGAVATSTRPAGPPAWVCALLLGLGFAGGFYLRGRVRFPLPF